MVNVGGLSNSDRSGDEVALDKAPNRMALLSRHLEWWDQVAVVSSTKGEMLCIGGVKDRLDIAIGGNDPRL